MKNLKAALFGKYIFEAVAFPYEKDYVLRKAVISDQLRFNE